MDGNGPCRPERQLDVGADLDRLHPPIDEPVADHGPAVPADGHLHAGVQADDGHIVGIEPLQRAQRAVGPQAVRVVGQRHDAGAGAQGEAPRRGVQVPRPFAAPHGVDADLRAGESRHHGSVDLVDAPVGGGEHGSGRRVRGVHAAVEQGERVAGGMAGAEGVQRAGERGVGLAVDTPQLREVHRERAAAAMMGARTRDWKNHGPFHGSPENSGLVVVGDDGGSWAGSPTMSTRTPPNGRRLRRAPWRNQSRQSMRSARAMAASSTMMWSNAR